MFIFYMYIISINLEHCVSQNLEGPNLGSMDGFQGKV